MPSDKDKRGLRYQARTERAHSAESLLRQKTSTATMAPPETEYEPTDADLVCQAGCLVKAADKICGTHGNVAMCSSLTCKTNKKSTFGASSQLSM